MTDNPVYRVKEKTPDRYDPEKFGQLKGLLPSGKFGRVQPLDDRLPKELDVAGLPDGEWISRGVYRMERTVAYGRKYGSRALENPEASSATLKPWGAHPTCVYLDLETTGLSGNLGAYAFLVGLGLCDKDAFRVVQLFLAGPGWERNWLAALENELPEDFGLVTYNGRSFDLPLLRTRYALARSAPSWGENPHLDLLLLARHFYRGRLDSCSLSTIEPKVLGLYRSGEDVPGREIPALYTHFQRTQNAAILRGVFYHNALDIISLAALQTHIANLAEMKGTTGEDMIRCGDLWKLQGDDARAEAAWRRALDFDNAHSAARLRLSSKSERRRCPESKIRL